MSHLAPAQSALRTGNIERAKALAMEGYDRSPGEAAALLAAIALEQDDPKRAEALGRTAMENFVPAGATYVADAIGRQGRRADAEHFALSAISTNPDSGLLRAVLGEQRVRQAKWDLGTQDFVDAFSLSQRDEVLHHFWRVVRDLTIGHRAGKVPTERALTFLTRVHQGAPRQAGELSEICDLARRALENQSALPATRPVGTTPPPLPTATPSRVQQASNSFAPPPPRRAAPNLVEMMRRDRALNSKLQDGILSLGLPVWPSNHSSPLDTLGAMAPKNLAIDQEAFRREHLNVTSGSVASEIVIERALQLLLSRAVVGSNPPRFDRQGVTQLEVALWDGALDRMPPIPPIYLSESPSVNEEVLAIGAFLAACVVYPAEATWTFERAPEQSTIETVHGDLHPFKIAKAWVDAADKDDVHLEQFLGEANQKADLPQRYAAHHDLTEALTGRPLAMRLAALWTNFHQHAADTTQSQVAESIRPLNITDDVIFFAISRAYVPGTQTSGEAALAYLRRTGEFLLLESRKHFARAVGVFCKQITPRSAPTILDMFSAFHAPNATVFSNAGTPTPARRGDATVLQFSATVGKKDLNYAMVHSPTDSVTWRLLEVE